MDESKKLATFSKFFRKIRESSSEEQIELILKTASLYDNAFAGLSVKEMALLYPLHSDDGHAERLLWNTLTKCVPEKILEAVKDLAWTIEEEKEACREAYSFLMKRV